MPPTRLGIVVDRSKCNNIKLRGRWGWVVPGYQETDMGDAEIVGSWAASDWKTASNGSLCAKTERFRVKGVEEIFGCPE